MQTPPPLWEPNPTMSPRDFMDLPIRYPRSTLWLIAGVMLVVMFCVAGAIR
jgi:hypothetical protein